MRLFSFLRRAPDASTAARTMRMQGVAQHRAHVRATVDEMRARMGMPKAEWPQ